MEAILLSQLVKGFASPANDCYITDVTTDSRSRGKGSLFLAIKGERVNGQNFARKALSQGAEFVITEDLIADVPAEKQRVVANVLDASIKMGANVRAKYNLDVIGVTGSVGKTTTKDFIYAAISPFASTVKSLGNRNNELGMPKTIYTFTQADKFRVLEMGMENFGDVHKLSMAAKPRAAVITGIGVSHLERMKTRENIFKAKMEICDGMSDDGVLVLNGDDDFLPAARPEKPKNIVYFAIKNQNADVVAKNIQQQGRSTAFVISDKKYGDFNCVIPTVGNHNVMDAMSAYAVATRFGFDPARVCKNLGGYEVSGWRQNFVEKNGALIIEDCYNAAPDSMKAAIDTLVSVAKGRKICCFGDMLELGEDTDNLHREVGEYAKEKCVDCMWTYGEKASFIAKGFGDGAENFATKQELTDYVIKNLKAGDTIVLKRSHSRKFEDILERIYKYWE